MALPEFRLRIRSGPDAGRELIVHDPETGPATIGRKADGARGLLCTDDKVSRRHVTIEPAGEALVAIDHESTNRTRINGKLIKPEAPVALRDGDEIQLGPDTIVVFEHLRSDAPTAVEEAGPAPRYEFGRYAVYESLSKGDIDRVDVAVDSQSGARVALKRIAGRDLSHGVRRRILDQAERAQRWQHPNIVPVLDWGQEGDVLYVAGRLVDGLSLAAVQRRCAAEVEEPLGIYIVREAATALHYAQDSEPSFAHGSLHPSNIMVSYTGEVALLNFGFVPLETLVEGPAKISRARLPYIAPEQRGQRGRDIRSDLFSLGTILYELLAREPVDPLQLTSIPDLAERRPGISRRSAAAAMRAMALRPEERFQSAAEMEEALTESLRALAPVYGAPDVTTWMIRMRVGVWE